MWASEGPNSPLFRCEGKNVHRRDAAAPAVGILDGHGGKMLGLIDRWDQLQSIRQAGGDGGGEGRASAVRFLARQFFRREFEKFPAVEKEIDHLAFDLDAF